MNITTQPGTRPAKKDGHAIHGVTVLVDGAEAGFVHTDDGGFEFGTGVPYCQRGREHMVRAVAEKFRAEQSTKKGAGGWPLVMPDDADGVAFPDEPHLACPACGSVKVTLTCEKGYQPGVGMTMARARDVNLCRACGKRETY